MSKRRRLLVLRGNGWHAPFGASPPFSAHDLVRKPDTTFRDHACAGAIFLAGVVVVSKARAHRRRENDFCCLQTLFKEVSLSAFARHFSLSDQRGHGVSCDQTGVFVGGVSLLEPCRNCGGFRKWRPRPMDELNCDLSNRYGVPVEFDAKLEALAAIARALDRGDLLHAHVATLHLQIPNPPPFANAAQSASEVVALAKQLHASGLLKRGWDPSKHPRWPARSLDSVGGRFAPADAALGAAPGYESSASTRTAQALPIPFEAVTPRGATPWPSEIAPPLGILPRSRLEIPILIAKDATRNGSMQKNIAGDCRSAAYWEKVIIGNMARRSSNAS